MAIKGGFGYGKAKQKINFDGLSNNPIEFETESIAYSLSLKYYLNNFIPLQLGFEGNKSGDLKNNYVLGQVGYAWFIKDNLALEPNVRYGLGLDDSESYFGVGIGFSIYF